MFVGVVSDKQWKMLCEAFGLTALAADRNVRRHNGTLTSSWELAREYGFTDYDGRRPDWGRHTIDFSVLPPEWTEWFRRGSQLELQWLTTLAARSHGLAACPYLTYCPARLVLGSLASVAPDARGSAALDQ